jgi:hypothetical protein
MCTYFILCIMHDVCHIMVSNIDGTVPMVLWYNTIGITGYHTIPIIIWFPLLSVP